VLRCNRFSKRQSKRLSLCVCYRQHFMAKKTQNGDFRSRKKKRCSNNLLSV